MCIRDSGALERYAMRRSIRYVRGPGTAPTLPVYGSAQADEDGVRHFMIDRDAAVERIPVGDLLRANGDSFLVRNFSQRLGFLLRPGALAHVDPRAPVSMGDLCFVLWRDGNADAALVICDGMGPLRLKLYNPEENIAIDDARVAGTLRIGMLILP